jgi:hypothetical protein
MLSLAVHGMASLLGHAFPDGVPQGPYVRFKSELGEFMDSCEVFLGVETEVERFLAEG